MALRSKACVVSLGRACDGELKRVQTWRRLFEAQGVEIIDIPLLGRHRRLGSGLSSSPFERPLVPEGWLWSAESLRAEIEHHKPDTVVAITTRAWAPFLADIDATLVLDFVDRLSVNYLIRAAHCSRPKAELFRQLAKAHVDAEAKTAELFPNATMVYAGHREATRYDGRWLPNLVPAIEQPAVSSDDTAPSGDADRADLVFFGALYTPINIDAIEALARHATGALADRSVVIAGRRPTKRVADLVAAHGWTLVSDFPSVGWLSRMANVSVAPLGPSTGIQNKVIDAGAVGLPVVASSHALAGLSPGAPLTMGLDQDESVIAAAEFSRLPRRDQLAAGESLREHIAANYTTEAWLPSFSRMIGQSGPEDTPTSVTHTDRSMNDLVDLGI